jgi:hypothetical protein
MSLTSDPQIILTQVAQAWRGTAARPASPAIVQALLQAEQVCRQQRRRYPLADLLGQWQLAFVVGKGAKLKAGLPMVSDRPKAIGRGFSIPQWTGAQISFSPVPEASEAASEFAEPRAVIGNQVQVGLVKLSLTGPARYPGQRNLLGFDFTQLAVSILGQSVYQGAMPGPQRDPAKFETSPIGRLPFFAFFSITPDYIAARGRGGGLAMWVKR